MNKTNNSTKNVQEVVYPHMLKGHREISLLEQREQAYTFIVLSGNAEKFKEFCNITNSIDNYHQFLLYSMVELMGEDGMITFEEKENIMNNLKQ